MATEWRADVRAPHIFIFSKRRDRGEEHGDGVTVVHITYDKLVWGYLQSLELHTS